MFIEHLPAIPPHGSPRGTIGSVKEYALGVFLLSNRDQASELRNELKEVLAVFDNALSNYDRRNEVWKKQNWPKKSSM